MGSVLHHGQLVEFAVRKKGISITELASMLGVDRRTVYKWFQSPTLKPQIIYRIGIKLYYDFAVDFPDYFQPDTFSCDNIRKANAIYNKVHTTLWKDKYIELLERYTQLLNLENKSN